MLMLLPWIFPNIQDIHIFFVDGASLSTAPPPSPRAGLAMCDFCYNQTREEFETMIAPMGLDKTDSQVTKPENDYMDVRFNALRIIFHESVSSSTFTRAGRRYFKISKWKPVSREKISRLIIFSRLAR